MVPTDALLTLPNSVVSVPAFSATHCSSACRSLKSSSSRPCSSAIRKTMLSTPSCVSLSCSRRASNTGPTSLTVVRMGWPFSPNRSQKIVGKARPA